MDAIASLKSRSSAQAYETLLRMEQESALSDVHYALFDDFLSLLNSPSSFVRVRGFRLACAQAPWDAEGRIAAHLDALLALLDDDKPTAVRQCLSALSSVVLYRPELIPRIRDRLRAMDLSRCRDSMRPLIEKDVRALQKLMD